MSAESAREDACREYQSSLEDLTFNSKPHINMLTILAEENLQFTGDIVAIIEAQIAKAPAAEKLPVLYLVDSIVKNVGGQYLEVFAKNLVTSFICVFEKVDENTRKCLFKLRSTWDDIFPLKKLYALDVRVSSVDPAWPIKPLPPNVNASIHVNPKFLKPTEEVALQPTVSEKNLAEEQIIRQQLLAKQKQLLELQQKKIELELEQTKAQLAASTNPLHSGPAKCDPPAASQPTPTPHKSWHPPQTDKPPNRDPRLNRASTLPVNSKEHGAVRKESQSTLLVGAPEKRVQVHSERQSKLIRIPKKDTSATDEKAKSKSMSPFSKGVHKCKDSEPEHPKTLDVNKKDPRLRKQVHEKTDLKEEDVKEKKRSIEKKEREEVGKGTEPLRSSNSRGKLANGSLSKHDRFDTFQKQDIKVSKTNVRKRSRSRSRSPPQHSPKRKERRSPKRRTRSISPPVKSGKGRLLSKRNEGDNQQANPREDRSIPKKNVSELRRLKRPLEDRTTEQRDVQPQRASPVEHKGAKDMKRWRSGWEENKPLKQPDSEISHGKPGLQRHKPCNSYQRTLSPRAPKQHRLSVDANLQIPNELHPGSKRDILRKASQRLVNGELTQEEFLNVAHQIKQIYQYQEEKQRTDSWDSTNNDDTCMRKKRPGHMSDAELSYLEHKSKLRRTQLQRPVNQSSPSKEMMQHSRLQPEHEDHFTSDALKKGSEAFKPFSGPNDPRRNDRPPSQTVLPFRPSPSLPGCDAMSGKSSLPFEGLAPSIDMDQLEDGDISPRFESPNSVHSDTGPDSDVLGPGRGGRNNDSPGQTPPLHVSEGSNMQVNMATLEGANVPARFDSHTSSHSQFEGPHGLMEQTRPEGPSRPPPPARYEGNAGPGRFDGHGAHGPARFDGHSRYDGPGPHRMERPPLLKGPGRYDNQSAPHRPMRFTEPLGRFEGQGSGRFDGPLGHQGPVRFDGPGPMRYNGPMHSNRFDGPARFDNPHMPQGPLGGFEGPMRYPSGIVNYEGPRRLEGPGNQPGMMCFDNPAQQSPMRFEGQSSVIQRFDSAPQGPPRYCGPTNMQNSYRPQGQMIDQSQNQGPLLNSVVSAHNFNMGAFDGPPLSFHMQQNVTQGSSFNVPEQTPAGFQNSYRPQFPGSAPANHPQPMPVMPSPLKNFGQLNPAPFNQPGSQFVQPESHLGQMDVNDLMAKLMDFGIIKPTSTADSSSESTSVTPAQSVPEEEEAEEEEQEEDDSLPDMTGFVVEDMKQRHESVITKLYTGIQCYSCGMRFTASQTDIYADHLDWHYRQNRSEKDISRKITHRRWYYSLTDWIEFEEIADLEERAKSQFFEKVHEEVVQKNQEAAKEREFQSVKAAADVVHECCEICQEQLEMYWEEDEEEWHLKNAIRVEEKTYHPLCYEDYINTSSFMDSTPSPNKMLTENPLNVFLKQETEGDGSCSSIKEEPVEGETEAVTVKQEVEDETEGGSQTISAIPF